MKVACLAVETPRRWRIDQKRMGEEQAAAAKHLSACTSFPGAAWRAVRSALLARCPPPDSLHSDPLLQTAEHLRCAFPSEKCPVAAYQYVFQSPIMG